MVGTLVLRNSRLEAEVRRLTEEKERIVRQWRPRQKNRL